MSTKKIQILGSMVPQSDWAQTDETKIDYVKNKPELGELATKDTVEKNDLATDVQESLNKVEEASETAAEAKTIAEGRAPAYTYGTTDLTAGSSSLATGTLHFVYE